MSEHQIQISERHTINLTGIKRVLNFDENEISLQSALGVLLIRGHGMHITMLNLDDSRVDVEGNINALEYKNADNVYKEKSKKVMGRLFK
ncbi:MAG: sporulation protein YabP [Syntrophomonadaceae bacterium]|nr:sporulation protein YabP [Syntrophomonadaceae bacterium]